MAGTGPGDLFDIADELKDICIEALDSIPDFTGLEDLNGAPAYAFVSPAAPIPDCCDDGMLAGLAKLRQFDGAIDLQPKGEIAELLCHALQRFISRSPCGSIAAVLHCGRLFWLAVIA